MGGCATKPKEMKAEAPVLEEEEQEEKAASKLSASKEVVVAEKVKKIDGETEIVEYDAADEHGNKRRSLSNLFKENEGKDSAEHDMTSLDHVKEEEPSANDEKIETQAEQMVREAVEVEAEAEKKVEVAPIAAETIKSPAATETQILEGKQLLEDKTETPEEKTTKGEEK